MCVCEREREGERKKKNGMAAHARRAGVCPVEGCGRISCDLLVLKEIDPRNWRTDLLLLRGDHCPRRRAHKGGLAADKRCVVAAVEIWTTILIVIGCRPTFPVGAIMALACTVCVQRETDRERRQPRLASHAAVLSIFGCDSMKSESAGAAMATAVHE